jgi:hypothetical protein
MKEWSLALLWVFLLAGCCADPWDNFPMAQKPDRSCRTNQVEGYDVYIWSCLSNQKVVVYKYSAEASCREPKRETAACNELTPIEVTLGDKVVDGCTPVPASLRWP